MYHKINRNQPRLISGSAANSPGTATRAAARRRRTQQDRLLEEAREITGQLPAKRTRIQRLLLKLSLGKSDQAFAGEEEWDSKVTKSESSNFWSAQTFVGEEEMD